MKNQDNSAQCCHACSIANQYIHRVNCHLSELHPHIVAYNGEIENEIRQLVREGWKFTDFSFKNDSDRERLMEVIESIRCQGTMNVQQSARSEVQNSYSSFVHCIDCSHHALVCMHDYSQ